jgi:hypothetical protein
MDSNPFQKWRRARGFALAYVVAGIALSVGVGYLATSAVMALLQSSQAIRAQGETLNSFNTVAKALAQQADDLDGDGLYEVEPASFADGEDSLSGGGRVPADQAGIQNDGWGQLITLCAWDFGEVEGYGFETPYGPRLPVARLPQTAPLFALISGGADRTRQTSCLEAKNNRPQGDDLIRTVSIGEVQKARAIGIEECAEPNQYNAFNPDTGRFECKSLTFAPDDGFSVDCPAGQIYNGEACVTPAAPDQLFESQRFATLFFQREVNNTALPTQHYRSLDLKGGVVALAYENNKVQTWVRNFQGGTWVPSKVFQSNNIGFFGSQIRIASNTGGPIKHKPQLLIAETFAGGITGKIYQHHLFNTMTHEALIGTDRKDFGFIDDIEKAAQAAPQLDELNNFQNLNSWPHVTIDTNITGIHQPSAMALREEHTPESFKAILAVGNDLHDNGKGRILIYEQSNANLNRFVLKQQIPAPTGSAEHQLFGRALDLNSAWLVAKSLPVQAGVATAGQNYFYRRNPDGSWPLQPTQTRPLDAVEAIERRYLEIPVGAGVVVGDDVSYQHKIENIAVGSDWIAIGEPINSRVPEAKAVGLNKSAVNAGAVIIYTYNAGAGGLPAGWYPRQWIYSPYRGTVIGTGAGQNDPSYNFFGNFIDMEGKYLAIVEPYYNSDLQEGNFNHSYVGLIYLYKNQDAAPSSLVWPESRWAPVHVFAKHLEPLVTSGYTGTLARKYIMGPVAVDGDTGEVAFLQVMDIWGSTAAEGCDGTDPNCSNALRYLSIYGPERANEALFVHADNLTTETCPNRHRAFSGPLVGAVTPITKFGLSRAANCFGGYVDAVSGLPFSRYNWQGQYWE